MVSPPSSSMSATRNLPVRSPPIGLFRRKSSAEKTEELIEAGEEQRLGALEGGIGMKVEPTVSGGGQTSTGTLGCFATTTNETPPKTVCC